jgi:hypothetical protein
VASVTPATLPRATPLRAGSRASRTLARLDAILTDEGESDALQRRAFGTALLVGGALSAATAVIPFVLPSSSTSASFSIAIASTSLTIGGLLAITGAVQMFQRGPWEQLAHELHEDPVTDPSARLAAALLRWERRIELERSGQRLTGGTVIAPRRGQRGRGRVFRSPATAPSPAAARGSPWAFRCSRSRARTSRSAS